jgi:YkoY family integral membrane protein
MLGQTFELRDLAVLALLVVLEGALSIDNALVLALLARRLPVEMRGRALSYGLVGALALRLVAVAAAAYLLRWRVVRLLGGLLLIYVCLSYLLRASRGARRVRKQAGAAGPPATATTTTMGGADAFWPTVVRIELTDLTFAVDSILAAVALVGPAPPGTAPGAMHPKLWVVYIGGMLGVGLMRVAGYGMTSILERFPRLETSAYVIVAIIGLKLLIEWRLGEAAAGHSPFNDVHAPLFWGFWAAILAALLPALLPKSSARPAEPDRMET